MIVVSKKRIQIIISCIAIAIFAFSFQVANNTKEEKTIETTATPVSGKTIVVDAGHGIPDEGAQSSNRNNRSTNKPKNCSKITKPIRK